MSKNPYEESAFVRFARGKGFYVVMAVFLIGAGITGAYLLTEEDPVNDRTPVPNVQMQRREDAEKKISEIEKTGLKDDPPVKEEPPLENISEEAPPKEEKIQELPASKKELTGVMPLKGEIIYPFSKGELVKDETMGDWRTHNGIDISALPGSQVVAFSSGKVKDVRNDSLWGTVVELEHPGAVITKYCGLDENVNVAKGDSIRSGEALGILGIIPCEGAKESHLHFEIIEKGKFKDPADFIR